MYLLFCYKDRTAYSAKLTADGTSQLTGAYAKGFLLPGRRRAQYGYQSKAAFSLAPALGRLLFLFLSRFARNFHLQLRTYFVQCRLQVIPQAASVPVIGSHGIDAISELVLGR